MAREWRDSGGRSGLPVVDFGNLLRVPRHALEELVGAVLTGADLTGSPGADGAPVATVVHDVAETSTPESGSHQRRPRARRTPGTDQLALFDPSATS